MRAREFLLEAQNYNDMFTNLIKIGGELRADNRWEEHRNQEIAWAKKHLKKNDRIIWYLRYVKLAVIELMFNQVNRSVPYHLPDEREKYKPILDALQKESQKTRKKMSTGESPNISYLRQMLEHFMSLPVTKIQQHTWGKESFQELMDLFSEYEEEWRKETEGTLDPESITAEDKKLIEFEGGKAWWLLPRGACRGEANAMGHCGNVPTVRSGQRILSFRTTMPNGLVKPHLTFILWENGYLGEMKGRGNEKPTEKYHPYIVELLMHDIIKGIKGGGYAPENNFSLNDLSEEQREALIDKKPNLGTIKMLAKKLGKDHEDVTNAIETKLEALEEDGVVRYFGRQHGKFELDHWKDIEQFCETTNGNMDNYVKYFNGDDTLDMWGSDTSYHLDDFFNGMPEDSKNEVKEIIQHIAKTDPDRITVPPEDVHDFYEFIKENELDEIITAGEHAILRGIEVGAESEMWDAFKSTTENLQNGFQLISDKDGGEWRFGEAVVLAATNDVMIELLSDENYMEEVEYEGQWLTSEVNIDEPYYGWSGYDEDAAYEDFSEMRIYDLKQELGMEK